MMRSESAHNAHALLDQVREGVNASDSAITNALVSTGDLLPHQADEYEWRPERRIVPACLTRVEGPPARWLDVIGGRQ